MEENVDQVSVFVRCAGCDGEYPAVMAAERDPDRPFRCDSCVTRASNNARLYAEYEARERKRASERQSDSNVSDKPSVASRGASGNRKAKEQSASRTVVDDGLHAAGGSGIAPEN